MIAMAEMGPKGARRQKFPTKKAYEIDPHLYHSEGITAKMR